MAYYWHHYEPKTKFGKKLDALFGQLMALLVLIFCMFCPIILLLFMGMKYFKKYYIPVIIINSIWIISVIIHLIRHRNDPGNKSINLFLASRKKQPK
jgi:hypothetical protein